MDSIALLLNTLPYLMKAQFTFQISLDIGNCVALSIGNTLIYDSKFNIGISNQMFINKQTDTQDNYKDRNKQANIFVKSLTNVINNKLNCFQKFSINPVALNP